MRTQPTRATMSVMNPRLARSRFLLVGETRPAGPQEERPQVRRYRLARLQVNPLPAAPSGGFNQPTWRQAPDQPCSSEEG